MQENSSSCGHVAGNGVLWQALERKSASAASNSALLWGSINFVICAILLALLDSPYVLDNVAYWWATVSGCVVCVVSLLTHMWCYLRPWLLVLPVTVTGDQQKLLALTDNECSNAATTTSKSASASSPVKNESISEVLQQSLRVPSPPSGPASASPADLSTTMLNTSALSWASSFAASPRPGRRATCPSHLHNTSMNMNRSWGSPSSLNMSVGCCQCGACRANTSSQFYAASPLSNTSFNSTGYGNSPSHSSLLGSPNTSVAATSWTFMPQLGGPISPLPSPPAASSITNRQQLNDYITECEQQRLDISSVVERCTGGGGGVGGVAGGLWCYTNTSHSYSPQHNHTDITTTQLKRNTYQKAIPDPVGSSGGVGGASDKSKDESNNASNSQATKVWVRRNVTPRQLFQFEENLRIWLCGTVVQPLVKGIEDVNKALADVAPDLQIGSVGVEKLRKACSVSSSLSGVRQLSGLIPFLERCPGQQQYLVTRLRQMAKGGALSVYSWDKGGSGWTEQCPSDALLLVQLFGLYMDSQLPPDPSQTDGRLFSSQHVVTTPDKPPQNPDKAILHITQLSPPHCRVLLPGEGECDVGEGHKNMLHCLLLFLHHLIHTQHSHIAGVNLALTGVNLAWVVTDNSS